MLQLKKATFVALIMSIVVCSWGAVINVPSQYGTVQAALNAASVGDEIVVGSGTYTENIVVNKAVTVSGAGGVVTPASSASDTITVSANGATLFGLTINQTNNARAILISGVAATVSQCSVNNGCIKLLNSMGSTVESCNVSSPNGFGIETVGNTTGTADLIRWNQVYYDATNSGGIAVRDAALDVTVEANLVWEPAGGIALSGNSGTVNLVSNYVYVPGTSSLLSITTTNSGSNEVSGGVSMFQNTLWQGNSNPPAGTGITVNVGSGAILNLAASFNRISTANAVELYGDGDLEYNVDNNWWGKNAAPVSDIDLGKRLQLRAIASATTVLPWESITVTADLIMNTANEDTSSLGVVPDSEDGYFEASTGYFYDPYYGPYLPAFFMSGVSLAQWYADGTSDEQVIRLTFDQEVIENYVTVE